MTLNEISIEQLRKKLNARVKSKTTGNTGKITFVSDVVDGEDYTVDIWWDNGAKTIGMWHHWLDNVELFVDPAEVYKFSGGYQVLFW